jgi:hypothetical protein
MASELIRDGRAGDAAFGHRDAASGVYVCNLRGVRS